MNVDRSVVRSTDAPAPMRSYGRVRVSMDSGSIFRANPLAAFPFMSVDARRADAARARAERCASKPKKIIRRRPSSSVVPVDLTGKSIPPPGLEPGSLG